MEVVLNKELLKSQGVEDRVDTLTSLHKILDTVLKNPEDFLDPVAAIEEIEFTLQSVWKFSEDRNYHSHWLRIKGCTCPVLDNKLLMGTPHRIISDACPWHYKGD